MVLCRLRFGLRAYDSDRIYEDTFLLVAKCNEKNNVEDSRFPLCHSDQNHLRIRRDMLAAHLSGSQSEFPDMSNRMFTPGVATNDWLSTMRCAPMIVSNAICKICEAPVMGPKVLQTYLRQQHRIRHSDCVRPLKCLSPACHILCIIP